MKKIALIFPNQLFRDVQWIEKDCHVFIVEEFLFFRHYNFHKQKLLYHRCSMKFYFDYLKDKGYDATNI